MDSPAHLMKVAGLIQLLSRRIDSSWFTVVRQQWQQDQKQLLHKCQQ